MRKKMLLLLMTGWTAAYGADYNIVDYGAKADTTILCTSALQQAIDDCSRAGGGRPHQGGIQAGQLAEIADSIADEKERSYPEATMWGTLPAMVTTARPNSMFSVKKYPISLVVCQKYRIFAPENAVSSFWETMRPDS